MAPKRKNNLKPIDITVQQEQKPVELNQDSNHITEESDITDYMKVAEQEEILEKVVVNTEIDELKKRNDELQKKIFKLTEEINNLKTNQNVTINQITNQEQIDKLINENDSLILKNSELEFENARLTETIRLMQSKKDEKQHTFTKEGYTPKVVINNRPNFRQSGNGYQDWR